MSVVANNSAVTGRALDKKPQRLASEKKPHGKKPRNSLGVLKGSADNVLNLNNKDSQLEPTVK